MLETCVNIVKRVEGNTKWKIVSNPRNMFLYSQRVEGNTEIEEIEEIVSNRVKNGWNKNTTAGNLKRTCVLMSAFIAAQM